MKVNIDLRFALLIDGVEVDGLITSESVARVKCAGSFPGVINSNGTVMPFKFSRKPFTSLSRKNARRMLV